MICDREQSLGKWQINVRNTYRFMTAVCWQTIVNRSMSDWESTWHTHSRSLWKQISPDNQLHWYWQPNSHQPWENIQTNKTKINKLVLVNTHTQNLTGQPACADFPNVVAERHKFELGWDFCTMHLPPSFIILCLLVQKLSCWQTYKQTLLKTSNTLCYATTWSKQIEIAVRL